MIFLHEYAIFASILDPRHDFLHRLNTIILPRVRDFEGLYPNAFDNNGNYWFGIPTQERNGSLGICCTSEIIISYTGSYRPKWTWHLGEGRQSGIISKRLSESKTSLTLREVKTPRIK